MRVNRTPLQKTWKLLQKLSILQLIPLGLVFGIRGCEYQANLENYAGKKIASACYSPDGRRVYGGGTNVTPTVSSGLLCAWDVATGKRLWEQTTSDDTRVFDITGDGRRLLTTVSNVASNYDIYSSVRILDAQTGALLHEIPNPNKLYAYEASCSPDGRNVLLVYENRDRDKGKIECWTLTGKLPTLKWQQMTTATGYLKPIWLDRQSELLMVSGSRRDERTLLNGMSAVELWDANTGLTRKRIALGDELFVAVSAQKTAVVVGGRQSRYLSLYDLKTGSMTARTRLPSKAITATGIEAVREKGKQFLQARLTYLSTPFSDSTHVVDLIWSVRGGTVDTAEASNTRDEHEGISKSPNGHFVVDSYQGNGNRHPPLLTLRDRKSGNVIRDFQGDAGWYPE